MSDQHPRGPEPKRDLLIAFICGGMVAGMIGLSFAAVPFYSWFCRTTGYGGTTQVAYAVQERKITRRINPAIPEPRQQMARGGTTGRADWRR